MICLDTSSLIAFLEGGTGGDVETVDKALQDQTGAIAPVTLAELLSDPELPRTLRETILNLPVLSATEGYWERAGPLRAKGLRTGHKAKPVDTLVLRSRLVCRITPVTSFQRF